MIDRLSPPARRIALFVIVAASVWFLWSVRSVLNPLILGYLAAFILHPLVLSLERRGWKRRRAVNVIFTAFAVAFTLLLLAVWWQGRGLAAELVSDEGLGHKVRVRVEQALEEHKEAVEWIMQLAPASPGVESQPGAETRPTETLTFERLVQILREQWNAWLTEEQQDKAVLVGLSAASGLRQILVGLFGSLMAFLALLILLPIYTYFLLFELERIHAFIARYLPRNDRERLVRIGRQIGEVLANFFRGRLLVCLVKGLFLTVGLALAGVDYAILIGMGTGFLTLIPFVGSAVGLLLALAVSMIEHSVASSVVRVGIVFVLAEALENYVLLPKILGNSLGLHPIVVLFSLMAGAASMGMFGLILALPLTATIVILAREFLLPTLRQMADNDGPPPSARGPSPGTSPF